MKKLLLFLGIIIYAISLKASDTTFTHFEVGTSVLYWTPNAAHLQIKESKPLIESSHSKIQGFGNAFAPVIRFSAYFKKGLGMEISYNYLKLEYTNNNYTNEANINNIRLGFKARIFEESRIGITFATGLNYVAHYKMEMPIKYPSDQENINLISEGSAFGVYFSGGVNIKIIKRFYFNINIDYSYIPNDFYYTAEYTYQGIPILLKQNEQSNLGGLGMEAGVSFRF